MLREIGRILRGVVRQSDLAARYGGEEFAVLLPHTEARGAMEMAERLRSAIRALKLERLKGERVTVSVGVSSLVPGAIHAFDQLVTLADRAMCRAKALGQDRVVLAGTSPDQEMSSGS